MNKSRAPVRFRARYIRVNPGLGKASSEMHIYITGLPEIATADAEIRRGGDIARLIEATLNCAFVAFAKPRKVEKSSTSC